MWPSPEAAQPAIPPALALAVTGTAGWLWGSFLAQLVDRLPPRAAGGPGPPAGVTLLRPRRSLCFGCGRSILWHDNVPVLSYLRLRGRCRHCGSAIGVRTLVLELATPAALLAWHAAWLRAGWSVPVLGLGLAGTSWLLVAAGALAGRRRWPAWLSAAGAALVACALLTLG